MMTQFEKEIVMQPYFTMHIVTDSLIEFQSQNKDWWILLQVEVYQRRHQLALGTPKEHTYKLYHKHDGASGFHEQGEYLEVLDAVLTVIDHDDYRMGKKRRGQTTHFEELLEWYRLHIHLQTVV